MHPSIHNQVIVGLGLLSFGSILPKVHKKGVIWSVLERIVLPVVVVIYHMELGCSHGHRLLKHLTEREVKAADLPLRITREELIRILCTASQLRIALLSVP